VITVATSESNCQGHWSADQVVPNKFFAQQRTFNEPSQPIYVVAKLLYTLFPPGYRNSERIAQQTLHAVIEGMVTRSRPINKGGEAPPKVSFSLLQNVLDIV